MTDGHLSEGRCEAVDDGDDDHADDAAFPADGVDRFEDAPLYVPDVEEITARGDAEDAEPAECGDLFTEYDPGQDDEEDRREERKGRVRLRGESLRALT
ncbi:MAG: hypothetical protein MZV70_45050 [Desulfobacterales bacterium]|nr:hypothetical protein [Desulfobacterales bacterium]